MLKKKLLRDFLCRNIPYLRDNPEKLWMDTENGIMTASLTPSLSHRESYTLIITLYDYTGSMALLTTMLNMWLRQNEPDIFATEATRHDGCRFETTQINSGNDDITIRLKLTERTIVTEDGNTLKIVQKGEPPLPSGESDPLLIFLEEKPTLQVTL
ncbi:phage tail protein [Salmonella enterica]|nr:phage tail protein [Salmonella enterica]